MTEFRTQERGFGATAVFRVVSAMPTTTLARQLPRRERWILLLIDGRRSVADLAHLTQRNQLDVAGACQVSAMGLHRAGTRGGIQDRWKGK